MKKVGFTPEHAGAIEATASTGGQLMPPVMGAAAFMMASFLGVPYAEVMVAGIIPAILYFWGVMLGVQFLAVRQGIRPPSESIDYGLIARRLPLFVLPLGVLVAMLLMYSPVRRSESCDRVERRARDPAPMDLGCWPAGHGRRRCPAGHRRPDRGR